MLCKPVYTERRDGRATRSYLELDNNLQLNNILTIMGVCFGCLLLLGMLEKLIIKYQSHIGCTNNPFSAVGDGLSLLCACIIYSVALYYLYGHNFEKTNFCLMNSDPTCEDVDVSCFTVSKTSQFINTVEFESGAIIDLTATGNRINYLLKNLSMVALKSI